MDSGENFSNEYGTFQHDRNMKEVTGFMTVISSGVLEI